MTFTYGYNIAYFTQIQIRIIHEIACFIFIMTSLSLPCYVWPVGFNWILGMFELSNYNHLNTLQLCIHIKLVYVGDLYGFR